MKSIALVFAVNILILGSVYSQDKPKFMVGGDIDFTYQKIVHEDPITAYHFNLNPSLGYFLNENLIFGLKCGFGLHNQYDVIIDADKYSTLSITPFVRFQKGFIDKLKFYAEPNLGALFVISDKSDYKRYYAGADFGLVYFITEKFSLELKVFELNYSYAKDDYNNLIKSNSFDLNYDLLSPNLGVKFYF